MAPPTGHLSVSPNVKANKTFLHFLKLSDKSFQHILLIITVCITHSPAIHSCHAEVIITTYIKCIINGYFVTFFWNSLLLLFCMFLFYFIYLFDSFSIILLDYFIYQFLRPFLWWMCKSQENSIWSDYYTNRKEKNIVTSLL